MEVHLRLCLLSGITILHIIEAGQRKLSLKRLTWCVKTLLSFLWPVAASFSKVLLIGNCTRKGISHPKKQSDVKTVMISTIFSKQYWILSIVQNIFECRIRTTLTDTVIRTLQNSTRVVFTGCVAQRKTY